MKTKFMRIYWRDWKELRHIFPGERNETCADYMARITEEMQDHLIEEEGGKR